MFEQDIEADFFSVSHALEHLHELERNTSDAIKRQRSSERLEVSCPVEVRPGNASERHRRRIEGMTGDISRGGCLLLLPTPVLPGDIYWLSISGELKSVGDLLARCVRCRMIQEDAFEVGFRFFHDVDLSHLVEHEQDSLL